MMRLRVRSCRSAACLALAAGGLGLGGCEVDSFFDPSVVGYWEFQPTIVPILDHIAAIDDVERDEIETSVPTRDDLLAEAQAYRLGPSDQIEVQVEGFTQAQRTDVIEATVDQRGYINFPKIGAVYILGKTEAEAAEAIARGIRAAEILTTPKVLVTITAQRQQTFSVTGGVQSPGSYFIPKPDYRVLEALTAAGGLDETAQKIYIIRQVPLSDAATGRITEPPPPPAMNDAPEPTKPLKPGDVDKLMEDILKEPAPKPSGGSPSAMSSGSRPPAVRRQPVPEQPDQPAKKAPEIDLIDSTAPNEPSARPMQPVVPVAPGASPPARAKTKWVFLNGQWTRDVRPSPRVTPPAPSMDPLAKVNIAADVMTQRVIELPAQRLLAGQADVNVVIRPGDVVRVPIPESGLYYVEGLVANPGVFGLPPTSKMTISQAIISAGGLSAAAIPQRVDLTRRIDKNRLATIRLNFAAIKEHTQPDVYLKPDDIINVGTNFWAFPLAVLRQGIRTSYGFGFILDRNFAGDVFGVDQSLNR